MSVFKTSYRRFCARFAGSQSRSTVTMRTRWAIHDKPKFEGLVHHLKDLIDGLNQVILVKRETQDQIMHDDIVSIIDISKLRLIQSACEGTYTTLSRVASTVIEASEYGTIDRRNIEEWLGDAKGMNEDDEDTDNGGGRIKSLSNTAGPSSQVPLFDDIPTLHYRGGVYFILTGQCQIRGLQSPCQLNDLAKYCAESKNSIIHTKSGMWSIGERIADTLDPNLISSVDLPALTTTSEFEMSDLQKLALPVATIYIYCAPCVSLLATAFSICRDAGHRAKTYFKFLVRPDDRLVSTCCSEKDRSLGLVSVLDKMKDIEVDEGYSKVPDPFSFVDRLWVEQRLYELEETDYPQRATDIIDTGGKVFSTHSSLGKTAGIVILGELDYCLPLMQSRPFPSSPRVPKEAEIFQYTSHKGIVKLKEWNRKFLGSFTPKPQSLISPFQRAAVQLTPTNNRQDATTLPPMPYNPTSSAMFDSSVARPRHISPPPSPASKRQKTSVAGSIIMENARQDPGESPDLPNIFTMLSGEWDQKLQEPYVGSTFNTHW